MTIDYDLIRSFHAVDAILNNEETAHRLREVANTTYTHDPRCKAINAIISKKSRMSQTELTTLRDFPAQGINIGLYFELFKFRGSYTAISVGDCRKAHEIAGRIFDQYVKGKQP